MCEREPELGIKKKKKANSTPHLAREWNQHLIAQSFLKCIQNGLQQILIPADLQVAGWGFEAARVTVPSRALEPLFPRGLEKPRGTELIKEPNHTV